MSGGYVKRQGRLDHGKVTLEEVAENAGVSMMTVSRVINGSGSVSAQTRARVEACIADMGYEPNPAARSLAAAGLTKIRLLYSNPSQGYLDRLLMGVLAYGRRSSIHVILEPCDTAEHALEVVSSLSGGRIEGLLVPPPLSDCAAVLAAAVNRGLPAVAIGGRTMTDSVSTVLIDDERAALEMTHHLISLGHHSIGFIKGQASQSSAACRLAGYLRALEESGITPCDSFIVEGDFTYRSGLAAAERLLGNGRQPTAVFASNDDMAAAVISAANRHGLVVPADLTVCGFDDTDLATSVWPELTTVRQPIQRMGETAAAILDQIAKRSATRPRHPRRRLMKHMLVRRGSDAYHSAPFA